MKAIVKFTLLTSLLGLIAMPVYAVSPSAGVFENVRVIEEEGDTLGMAVEYRPGARPLVIATICEGECYGGKAWPAVVDGNRISFTVCNDVNDQNGRPLPCEKARYVAVFRDENTLVVTMDGNPDVHEVLKRVPHPEPHSVELMGCGADHC